MKTFLIPVTMLALIITASCDLRNAPSTGGLVVTNTVFTNDPGLIETALKYPPSAVFLSPSGNTAIYETATVRVRTTDNRPGVTLQLVLRGSSIPSAVESVSTNLAGATNYTVTFTNALNTENYPDGYHALLAVAADIDGNTVTNALTLIVQNDARRSAYVPQALITNISYGSFITQSTALFAGTASVGAGTINSLSLLISNAATNYTVPVTGSGAGFTWNVSAPLAGLADGPFTARVIALTDETNNRASAPVLLLSLDTANPALTLDNMSFSTNVRRFYLNLSGTASDAGSGIDVIEISISNRAGARNETIPAYGASSLAFVSPFLVTAGTNLVTVATRDRGGRVSAAVNRVFTGGNQIMIDGQNDFEDSERISTTSGGYTAYLAADSLNIYLAYEGADMGNTALSNNILAVYIGTNTNAPGNTFGVGYASGRLWSDLPFNAHYHLGFPMSRNWTNKSAGMGWGAGFTWTGQASFGQGYLELTIPLADIGSYPWYAVTAHMLLESSGFWNYAGLGAYNFTDNDRTGLRTFALIHTNTGFTLPAENTLQTNLRKPPHTVTIDGNINGSNSPAWFYSGERFYSSSDGYEAYITWDTTNIYFGCRGADVSPAADGVDKLIVAYFGTNAPTGTTNSVVYNTQGLALPFSAQYVFNWQADWANCNTASWNGASWNWSNPLSINQNTNSLYRDYDNQTMEWTVKRSLLGNPSKIQLLVHFIKKKAGDEWTYGIVPQNAQTDGYKGTNSMQMFSKYIEIDFGSARAPNDPANIKP